MSERGRHGGTHSTATGSNSHNSGLSMRLMPLNIPSLMTSPQSKVAPLSLGIGGILVDNGSKE